MGLYTSEGKVTLSMTNQCNIDCIYCYSDKEAHHKQVLSLDFAKQGIADFFGSSTSRRIRFFGSGEPTVEIESIKKIVEYARGISEEDLDLEIQTNGIFGKKTAKYLADNFNTIYVSSDGSPDIQNYSRPGKKSTSTSNILEENLKFFRDHAIGRTAIRATIGRFNLDRQEEIIRYFHSLGVAYIWTRPIFPPPIGENKGHNERVEMKVYVNKFVEAQKIAKKLGVFYGSFLACNFDGNSPHYCSATRPSPLLTTDGYVSSCDNVLFGENTGIFSFFVYGKWDPIRKVIEYDPLKIDALKKRTVDNIPGCDGCSIKYKCGGHCIAEILEETGKVFGKKISSCHGTLQLAKLVPTDIENYKCRYP